MGGIVYGAELDMESFEVRHKCAKTISERNRQRGSKYVQSNMMDVFKEIKEELKQRRYVLFTGTPCQCAAIDAYLGERPDNLLMVDVLCNGVSSDMLLQEFIKYWEEKKGHKIVDYKYRSKKYVYEYTQEIEFDNGDHCTDIKLRQLLKIYPLTMRPSCYNCPYAAKKRYGDFTIGDCWNAGKIAGIYDHRGVSLIMTNTTKASSLMTELEKTCKIHELPQTILKQNTVSQPMKEPEESKVFWQDYTYGFKYALDKHATISMKSFIYQNLLRILYYLKIDSLYERLKR